MTDLKDLTHRLYKELFENHDIDAVDHLFTQDAIDHEMPPGLQQGREGIRTALTQWLDAFSPMTVHVHEQYQDGDTVIVNATFHATHSGDFMGLEATNKRVTMNVIDILRFEGDQVAEHWGQTDMLGLLAQVDRLPEGLQLS